MSEETHDWNRRKALKTLGVGFGATPFLTGGAQSRSSDEGGTPDFVANARQEMENVRSAMAFEESVRQHYLETMRSMVGNYEGSNSSNVSTAGLIDPRKSVWLGDDTTLDMKYGDKYESDDEDSLQDAELKARFDTYADTIEAYAWDNAGYGTFVAWAYIGREFVIEDSSGSQTATITVRPDVVADMGVFGECGNSAYLELIVWDLTDDEKFDETIFSHADYAREWSKEYTDSMMVDLQAGHGYTAICKITAETTCQANAGSAVSDFSLHDDDEKVYVGGIDIKF